MEKGTQAEEKVEEEQRGALENNENEVLVTKHCGHSYSGTSDSYCLFKTLLTFHIHLAFKMFLSFFFLLGGRSLTRLDNIRQNDSTVFRPWRSA